MANLTTSIDTSSLGYNQDYQNGYAPSMPADTSRGAYNNWRIANGLKSTSFWTDGSVAAYEAWRDSMNNYYQAYYNAYNKGYDDWYNSPEQVIARARAAGQNPYYTDMMGQPAQSAGAFSPEARYGKSQAGQDMDAINSSLNNLMNVAGLLNGFLNDEVTRENTVQQTIGQALENRKGYYMLGGDRGFLGFNSEYLGFHEKSAAAKAFNRIKPDVPIRTDTLQSKNAELINNSPFAGQIDASIGQMRSNTNLKQYQVDNILPSISSMYRLQSAVSGLSKEEADSFHKEIWPFVKQAIQGEYVFNKKAISDDWLTHFQGTKLEGVAKLALQVVQYLSDSKINLGFNFKEYNTYR